MNRLDVLKDLIMFSKSIEVLKNNLSQFNWDYDGEPLVIDASQIKDVLLRYLSGEINEVELEGWANLIECREDLEFEVLHQEKIENIIYCLANPALEGNISPSLCQALLKKIH